MTRRSSGVAPRACVRVYARVLVPPNLYIHTYINRPIGLPLGLTLRVRGSLTPWPTQDIMSLVSG